MTQEDKQLLLVDLCARLPYGVKANSRDGKKIITITSIGIANFMSGAIDIIKPYLRPMSSMTEEEQKILEDFGVTISPFLEQMHIPFDEIEFPFITMQKIISYLYSIHIDINGLIPKGLAIEVTENNNPYKD